MTAPDVAPAAFESFRLPSAGRLTLATDVYRPPGPGPFPAMLLRTYLGRRQHAAEALGWVRQGYACVVQDVRGRFDSPGSWEPFARHERSDGRRAVQWVAEQAWSDGRIILKGGSYGAWAAWAAAVGDGSPHPAVVAVISAVPAVRPVDFAPGDGGMAPLFAHSWWWLTHGDTRLPRQGLAGRLLGGDGHRLRRLPVAELFADLEEAVPGWRRYLEEDPDAPPPLVEEELAAVTVPTLHIGGWYDPFLRHTLDQWRVAGRDHRPRPPRGLILGPWTHELRAHEPAAYGERSHGPTSRLPLGRLQVAWLRAVGGAGPRPPSVRAFVTGLDRWLQGETFPPLPTTRCCWYAANGGRLVSDPPAARGSDAFLYDPQDPFPSRLTPLDERDLAHRQDRLAYSTPVLEEGLLWIGTPRAFLWVAADTAVDWVARLLEITREGRILYLTHGLVDAARALAAPASRRHETTETPQPLEIPLTPGAVHIPPGHRLRLELTGSLFPSYARNLGTGEHRLRGRATRPRRQRLFYGGAARTRLELPWVSPQELPP